MPILRHFRNQTRVSLVTVSFLSFLFIAYVWLSKTRQYYNNAEIANERCLSELSSVRYQLDVVSDYKKKMDWLLTETQKEYKLEKNQVKEMMENYLLVKHHLLRCETQTEELEKECQDLKEELKIVKQELEQCKKLPG